MGRMEELREKIRRQQASRQPEPALVCFTEHVNAAVKGKGVYLYSSCSWVQRTFEEARGVSEEDWDAWIAAKTEGLFLSAAEAPHWPEDELGDWCFEDDVPLTFVGQMPAAEPGWQLFVFTGARRVGSDERTEAGLRAFYKMLVYGRDGSKAHVHGMISY